MFVMSDYILNGAANGQVAGTVAGCNFDPGLLRPFIETDPNHPLRGQRCVIVNSGKFRYDEQLKRDVPVKKQVTINSLQQRGVNSPVFNATSLRKEEWIHLDQQVVRAARYRLRASADLAAANSFGGFNGMAKMILEHEVMSDPGDALVDMDGLTPGRADAPLFQLRGLPLPITHVDFWFSSRTLAASRNSGTPLDTTMGEAAGRRVAETIEKTVIGNQTGMKYGGASTQVGGYDITSQVYGYTNHPNRLTAGGYKPTGNGRSGSGWVAADTLKDVLSLLDTLRLNKFYGPFMVYHSNDWDQYLDNDYILTGGNVATQTLRERLRAIDGIQDVRRLDMLFASTPSSSTGPGGENLASTAAFQMVLVQMTPDVCRMVNGMDITTVQWEEKGGLRLQFKVMAIQVPQIRVDFYNNSGIMHATFAT